MRSVTSERTLLWIFLKTSKVLNSKFKKTVKPTQLKIPQNQNFSFKTNFNDRQRSHRNCALIINIRRFHNICSFFFISFICWWLSALHTAGIKRDGSKWRVESTSEILYINQYIQREWKLYIIMMKKIDLYSRIIK